MQEKLRKVEAQLQDLIENKAARIFTKGSYQDDLAHQLVSALESQFRVNADSTTTAPHIFSLNVSPEHAEEMRANQKLLDQLARDLMQFAEKVGVNFDHKLSINVFPDSEIKEGEFSVRAIWSDSELVDTRQINPEASIPNDSSNQPPKAFLIVGGTQIFTLGEDVVNIGRKSNNQLLIDDPRVSRTHAQLRTSPNGYIIFDLDSSGGTFVNDERITECPLQPGDVISLAGVPLIFGQDAVRAVDETAEYHPPEMDTDASLSPTDPDDALPDTTQT